MPPAFLPRRPVTSPGDGAGFLHFSHSTICRACAALSTMAPMIPPTPVSSTRITLW